MIVKNKPLAEVSRHAVEVLARTRGCRHPCSEHDKSARMRSGSRIEHGGLVMELTLSIPDELAGRLRPVEDRLPQILELGLREWLAGPTGYAGLGDLIETLARLPSPDEILALRPTPALQERIEELLARNRDGPSPPRNGASGSATNTSSISSAWPRPAPCSSGPRLSRHERNVRAGSAQTARPRSSRGPVRVLPDAGVDGLVGPHSRPHHRRETRRHYHGGQPCPGVHAVKRQEGQRPGLDRRTDRDDRTSLPPATRPMD